MKTIKVSEFSKILRNRNSLQTDGLNTGEEFREKHLKEQDNQEWWNNEEVVSFDFAEIITLGPSWANEVFAYFTKFPNVNEKKFLKKFIFENISSVKLKTILMEVKDGYRGILGYTRE
jgi:hypothetical protein